MHFTTFAASVQELEARARAPELAEVLLEPALLAQQGQLSDEAVQTLAQQASVLNLRPVLVWDALMPERTMAQVRNRIADWDFSSFSAVRVSDPGAAYWLRHHVPDLPLQLIVETGNHNFEALKGWCEIFADQLERLVLSIELPEAVLIDYCQRLPVACEVLGAGPILLFYSPRSLLATPLQVADRNAPLDATIAFEETPQRRFPTKETAHGTFMFLDKDQFILDRLAGLQAAGLQWVRLDLRHLAQEPEMAIDRVCQQALTDPVALRDRWPRSPRAPFFNANRTTSLFQRLQSKLTRYRPEIRLAEAIAGESGDYVVFQALQPFARSRVKCLVVTTGEERPLPESFILRDLDGHPIEQAERNQLFVTHWLKRAMPGSLLIADDPKISEPAP